MKNMSEKQQESDMPKIEISEYAYEYLQAQAIPFEDTPAQVFDRIISEHSKDGDTAIIHQPTFSSDRKSVV